MKGKNLRYKDVFSEYQKDCLDILVKKAVELRLWTAEKLGNTASAKLKDFYKHYKECVESYQCETNISAPMPDGHNGKKNTIEKGRITLEYLDLYDFLPKENFQQFKRKIVKYRRKNEQAPFSFFMTAEEFEEINRLENFSDWQVFQNIITCKIKKNQRLSECCTQVLIQAMSLSPTYLIVKYRFFASRK